MLATLGVGEIATVILMYCKAQPTLEAAYMILKEVRVFIKIYCLQGEFPEPFSAVCVCG